MTEINFYRSFEQGLGARVNVCLRLLDKALQRNMIIHIHTDSLKTSEKLSEKLWKTGDSTSFYSNCVLEKSDDTPNEAPRLEKITISHEYSPMQGCDYLINISGKTVDFFSRFKKMAEVIDSEEDALTASRERYVFYRERGYNLAYHELR